MLELDGGVLDGRHLFGRLPFGLAASTGCSLAASTSARKLCGSDARWGPMFACCAWLPLPEPTPVRPATKAVLPVAAALDAAPVPKSTTGQARNNKADSHEEPSGGSLGVLAAELLSKPGVERALRSSVLSASHSCCRRSQGCHGQPQDAAEAFGQPLLFERRHYS